MGEKGRYTLIHQELGSVVIFFPPLFHSAHCLRLSAIYVSRNVPVNNKNIIQKVKLVKGRRTYPQKQLLVCNPFRGA